MKTFHIFYIVMLSLFCANSCSAMKKHNFGPSGEGKQGNVSKIKKSVKDRTLTPKNSEKFAKKINSITRSREDEKNVQKIEQTVNDIRFSGLEEAKSEFKKLEYIIP